MDEYIGMIGGADGPTAIAMGGTFVGILLVIYFLILFFAMAFSVAIYVLHSLGLYTIANRRGIAHAWLAWLPLGNIWILGSISDQYQYVVKGKVKNRRKILLGLSIGVFAVYFVWLVGMIASAIAGGEPAVIAGMLGGVFALMIAAIVLTILEYIAYYDLFHSCQPSNAVLYLVLSILFNVTLPFFLFFIRKKDLGMPPRKQPVVAETVVEAPTEEPTVGVDAFGDPSATEEPAEETTEE